MSTSIIDRQIAWQINTGPSINSVYNIPKFDMDPRKFENDKPGHAIIGVDMSCFSKHALAPVKLHLTKSIGFASCFVKIKTVHSKIQYFLLKGLRKLINF